MPGITNFGGNIRFTPRKVYSPRSEHEVLAILNRHANEKIRVGGALHSWNPAVASAAVFIDLKHLNTVSLHRDSAGELWATVGGGCRIKHLLHTLHTRSRYTMPTVGLITEQSIAGAISTATHGSGRHSLSHYMESIRTAAYDPRTGKACIYEWTTGDERRAARCAIGCMGVVLTVTFRCIPQYDVVEHIADCNTIDDVLSKQQEFPLQQAFLIPHRWRYYAQRRQVSPAPVKRRSWLTHLYRTYWFLGLDIGLHLVLVLLASEIRLRGWIRAFYRGLLPRLIMTNATFIDRAEHMLIMEHELFRHVEIELFIQEQQLQPALDYVIDVMKVVDGATDITRELNDKLTCIEMVAELTALRGTYTHHYPIAIRRVLPDDTLISTSSGSEPYYALSFIALSLPRGSFYGFADFLARSMATLFGARPHWGKYFPLDGETVSGLYPDLRRFREICNSVDPRGVFRNEWVQRAIFHSE